MSITSFFKSTRAEMRHVVWPSRRKAVLYTVVVIILSAAVGYALGGFDSLFRVIFRHVY